MSIFEAHANLMCENQENRHPEGKNELSSSRSRSHRSHRPSSFSPAIIAIIIAIILMATLAIMVLPIIPVHRVYVTIGQDMIVDVSAQTTRVPEISLLFPSSSPPTGVYTITIQVQGIQVQNLTNVPIGMYAFNLQNVQTGTPVTITVSLLKNGFTITTFPITVTF